MRLAIPRGVIYHRVLDDLSCLARAVFARLDDESTITAFESTFAAYVGRKHGLAFPSARTAILSALRAKELPAGAEIIMPPITIKPILDVVLACGLVPVFVDLDPETICFDLEKLKQALTPNTKAILITYLFGIVPDMDALMSISRAHGLFVLEDFSQCLNGTFAERKTGSFGDVGIYSSTFIKQLDTYGGGQLVCDDSALFDRLKGFKLVMAPPSRRIVIRKILFDLLMNIATTRWVFGFVVFPLLRLISLLRPERVIRHVDVQPTELLAELPKAWFHRYSSLQAELGLRLLPTVAAGDDARVKHVERIKALLRASQVRFPRGVAGARNVYWQLVTHVHDARRAQRFLHARGIDTSTTSLTHVAALPDSPYRADTPWAKSIHANALVIPAYPGLRDSDVSRIAAALNRSDTDSLL